MEADRRGADCLTLVCYTRRATRMTEPLFTVESTFTIRGRGLVIEGFKLEQYPLFNVGDVILIHRPDGSQVQALIQGVEPPVGAVYLGEPPPISERRYGLLIDIDTCQLAALSRRTG